MAAFGPASHISAIVGVQGGLGFPGFVGWFGILGVKGAQLKRFTHRGLYQPLEGFGAFDRIFEAAFCQGSLDVLECVGIERLGV